VVDEPAPLLVLGTRPFAVEIADLAEQTGLYRVAGFVENWSRERCEQPLEGLPVYWIDDVEVLADSHVAVCALGTTKRSRFVEQAVERGLRFATVVHPSAQLSAKSRVGEGSIVGGGSVVGARAQLGRHVIVNRGCLVGHHTEVGDYASIMAGANVAGSCRIGEKTYVGMGAVVLDHVSIGWGSIVGAGAVVTADVPDNVQVVGVPARVVKEGVEGL
jgi:sugar O-acyltransferase (sialic acid O-acetyltransferase NeuD family)